MKYIYFCLALLLVVSCSNDLSPILIGFSGELTGKRSNLSIAARDGAQLAVDMINQQGGIQGHPLQLIIKDDKGTVEGAKQADSELVAAGVVAIIGHMTSNLTAAVLPQMNQAKVVLFSPTSSSEEFAGKSDYLFRMIPTTLAFAKPLPPYLYTELGIHHLIGIIDLNNRDYTLPLWNEIRNNFIMLGGEAGEALTFTSGQTDLQKFIENSALTTATSHAIVILASPTDTALLAQYIRQLGIKTILLASAWAQDETLLSKGGRAVEGLLLASFYNPTNPRPEFQDFVQRFIARYQRQPTLGAPHAYECVLALAAALKQTGGKAAGLPEALITIHNLAGVQEPIFIDKYGDPKREVYIAQVKDGKFQVIRTVAPAP